MRTLPCRHSESRPRTPRIQNPLPFHGSLGALHAAAAVRFRQLHQAIKDTEEQHDEVEFANGGEGIPFRSKRRMGLQAGQSQPWGFPLKCRGAHLAGPSRGGGWGYGRQTQDPQNNVVGACNQAEFVQPVCRSYSSTKMHGGDGQRTWDRPIRSAGLDRRGQQLLCSKNVSAGGPAMLGNSQPT